MRRTLCLVVALVAVTGLLSVAPAVPARAATWSPEIAAARQYADSRAGSVS